MGNRECGRRDVQRDVLRYVLREMRWLASPFVDWARSRGGVHSRHDQLLVPRASSEGVWAFLCRCCMRSRVATTARPAPEADENTEFPVLTAICPETCVCACPLPLGVFFDLLTLPYACRRSPVGRAASAAQQNEAAPPAERAAAGVGFRVVARSTAPVRGTRTMQWRGRADSESDSRGTGRPPTARRVSESRVGRFGDVLRDGGVVSAGGPRFN